MKKYIEEIYEDYINEMTQEKPVPFLDASELKLLGAFAERAYISYFRRNDYTGIEISSMIQDYIKRYLDSSALVDEKNIMIFCFLLHQIYLNGPFSTAEKTLIMKMIFQCRLFVVNSLTPTPDEDEDFKLFGFNDRMEKFKNEKKN